MATLLLGAADSVKSQFSFKEVDSANMVFKLFAKISFGLCISASVLVATSEYIGEPIKCEHGTDKIDEGLFTTYCWIHGSKKIAKNYQKHFECKANVVRYFSGWMLPNFFRVANNPLFSKLKYRLQIKWVHYEKKSNKWV